MPPSRGARQWGVRPRPPTPQNKGIVGPDSLVAIRYDAMRIALIRCPTPKLLIFSANPVVLCCIILNMMLCIHKTYAELIFDKLHRSKFAFFFIKATAFIQNGLGWIFKTALFTCHQVNHLLELLFKLREFGGNLSKTSNLSEIHLRNLKRGDW